LYACLLYPSGSQGQHLEPEVKSAACWPIQNGRWLQTTLSPEDYSNTCATVLIRVNLRSMQSPMTVPLTTDHAPSGNAALATLDGQAVVWIVHWLLGGPHPLRAIPARPAVGTLSNGEGASPWHFRLREERGRAPTTCPRHECRSPPQKGPARPLPPIHHPAGHTPDRGSRPPAPAGTLPW